ncbi:DUF4352 domain-containing protein [Paenibacillus zeisoli]|nr:DUF4352 domain-containing protein [Paenibacillus zeisoli]
MKRLFINTIIVLLIIPVILVIIWFSQRPLYIKDTPYDPNRIVEFGEEIINSPFKWTVNKATIKKQDSLYKYISVNISVLNFDKDPLHVDANSFVLRDSGKREYTPVSINKLIQSLSHNENVTENIDFKVPNKAKELKLLVKLWGPWTVDLILE